MKRPVTIAVVDCHTCTPWSRWIRSGSGAWVAQERHENHCDVHPHVQRTEHAAYKAEQEKN